MRHVNFGYTQNSTKKAINKQEPLETDIIGFLTVKL